MNINKVGVKGEISAARYLRDNGCKIITSNFRTRLGEIDLIVTDGAYIAYVEVKTRTQHSIAEPAEFVDSKKQKRICLAAGSFQNAYPVKLQERFDVIEVILDEKLNPVKINHIKNAFESI